MTKHTIEIEGLPEGWEAVTYRQVRHNEDTYIWLPSYSEPFKANANFWQHWMFIVQKTKPRRIVLEETDRDRDYMKDEMITIDDRTCVEVYGDKIWRIKEE